MIIFDPRVFNWLIMGLYVLAIIRWAVAGNWPASIYWGFALGLTYIVTEYQVR
jgi:hypothetical protein